MHEISDKGRAFFLKNILFSIKIKKHDSLQDHLFKIKDIQAQLKAIDRKMENKDLVIITLKSLPSKNFIETLNIISSIDAMFEQLSNNFCKKRKQFRDSSGHDISDIAWATKFKGG